MQGPAILNDLPWDLVN